MAKIVGIDIGFTDESLQRCKYSLCKSYRKKIVAFFHEPPEKENDTLAQYRQVDRIVNMNLLSLEEPTIYNELIKGELPFAKRDTWPWNKAWFKDYFTERKKARMIEPYVQDKPSSRVLLDGMPQDMGSEWLKKVGKENWQSAWYSFPFERWEQICKPCPIRPLDESNCYLRFSNYPGMNNFRQGFMLAVLYTSTIDEERLKETLFSFPHLDRTKKELPKDKIEQLIEMCDGTPINRGAEGVFNTVLDMLNEVKPEGIESDAEKINMVDVPFIDEFISKYIYRAVPYSIEETRRLIPYVETLYEVAEWAVWDTNIKPIRDMIIAFQNRIDRYKTALKIADKYELEIQMSY